MNGVRIRVYVCSPANQYSWIWCRERARLPREGPELKEQVKITKTHFSAIIKAGCIMVKLNQTRLVNHILLRVSWRRNETSSNHINMFQVTSRAIGFCLTLLSDPQMQIWKWPLCSVSGTLQCRSITMPLLSINLPIVFSINQLIFLSIKLFCTTVQNQNIYKNTRI